MKKCFLLACAVCAYGWVEAATVEISSPDKKLVVAVSDDGGRPSYTVSYDGVVFLEQSPLGLRTNVGDFAQGLALAEADFKSEAATVSYDMRSIKRSHVERQATQAVCPFTKDGKRVMDVVFHVSDNDVAFKYKVYPQRDRLCAVVTEEATGFRFPAGTTTFLCPQSKPMGGFARTSPSYETSYTVDDRWARTDGARATPCPCLFRTGDKGWCWFRDGSGQPLLCSRLLGHDGGL